MYKFTYFSVEKLIFIGKQDGITKKKKKKLIKKKRVFFFKFFFFFISIVKFTNGRQKF